MKLLKFQVLPLRVLASREVVRERLDYKEHLVGATRDELDNLEKLSGRFKEIGAETVVKTLDEEGEELEEVDEDRWEEVLWQPGCPGCPLCPPHQGRSMLTEFEEESEIIIEENNKEKRGWRFKDTDGSVWMDTQLWMDTHKEEHFCANFDNYIEDGELVLPVKIFCWVGLSEGVARPIEDKQIFFRVERTDSFSLDSKQNLVWKTVQTDFKYKQKLTHTRKLKRVTPNSTSLGWQCQLM